MANEPWKAFQSEAPEGDGPWSSYKAPEPVRPVPTEAPKPTLKRTTGQVAKDLAVGVGQGTGYLFGGMAELANTLTLGGADKAVRHANAALSSLITGDGYKPEQQNGITEAYNFVNEEADKAKSPVLRRKQQELADTKGFVASAKKVLTDPALATQFVAEQAPNLAMMGAGAGPTLARGVALAEARGLAGKEAADAGRKFLERQIVLSEAAQEAGPAAQQLRQQVAALPQATWDANPEYQARVRAGEDPDEVKASMANIAALKAAGVGGAAGALGGKLTAPLEGRLFTREALDLGGDGLLRTVGKTAVKEAAEETIQEGGNQFGTNVGMRDIDPNVGLMEGVPEAAGTGAALGGLLGGGMAGAGHLSQRPTLQRETPPPQPEPTPEAPRALPAPDTIAVDAAGNAMPNSPNPEPEVFGDATLRYPQGRGMATPQLKRVPFPDAPAGSLSGVLNDTAPMAGNGQPVLEGEATRLPRGDLTGNAAYEERDVETDLPPPPPNVDPATGEVVPWSRQQIKDYLAAQLDTNRPGALPKSGIIASVYGLKPREANEIRQEVIAEGKARALSAGSTTDGAGDAAGVPVAAGVDSGAGAPVAAHAPGSLGEAADTAAAHAAPAAPATDAVAGTLAPAGETAHPHTTSTSAAEAAPAVAAAPAETAPPSAPETAPAAPLTSEVPVAASGEASAATDQDAVTAAAHEAATSDRNDRPAPTEAQKEAGNYKKGHVKIAGLDISIENPAGSKRREEWPALAHHYGYIKGSVGKDKDHVDVFLTERADDTSLPVFVVDQHDAQGGFDEHKVVLGAATEDEARAAYRANYGADWNGDGAITQMSHAEFEAWVRDPDKTTQPAGAVSDFQAARAALAQQQGFTPADATREVSDRPPASAGVSTGPDEIRPQGKKMVRGFGKAESVTAAIAERGLNPDDYTIERTPENGYYGKRKAAEAPAVASAEDVTRFVAQVQDALARQDSGRIAFPTPFTHVTERDRFRAQVDTALVDTAGGVRLRGGSRYRLDGGEVTLGESSNSLWADVTATGKVEAAAQPTAGDKDEAAAEGQPTTKPDKARLIPRRTEGGGITYDAVPIQPEGVPSLKGEPDPKNGPPLETLEGVRVGDRGTVEGRTLGEATVETLFMRDLAGSPIGIARVVGADGKRLDVNASAFRKASTGPIARVLVNQVGRDGLTDAERDAGKKPLIALSEPQMKRLEQLRDSVGASERAEVKAARKDIDLAIAQARRGESPQIVAGILDRAADRLLSQFPVQSEAVSEVAEQVQAADERTAASPVTAQNAPQETDDVRSEDHQRGDRPGSVRGDQREQPAEDRNDDPAADLEPGQPVAAARPGARGAAGAGAEEGVSQRAGGRQRSQDEQSAPDPDRVPAAGRAPPDPVVPKTDLTITTELDFAGVGPVAKFKNNLAAIALLKQLEAEGRRATPQEQSVLAKYVGWGGLPQAFRHPTKGATKGWEARVAELEAALTPEELAAAARSTQDAHYTAANVVTAMWDAVARLGFQQGRVLEPSMGVGNFFGLMPSQARSASQLTGVELDSVTGRIAKQLYQTANVQVRGFNDIRIAPGSFDLAIGNPPFGAQAIHDAQYPELAGFSIHNYFFAKAIASLRPGGVLAMVVSNSFLDANTSTARAWIAERARLLGAIRLPQTAFQANANTAVTTDIVFLQRLAENEDGNADEWVRVGSSSDQGNAFPLNKYFLAHPDMLLGRMTWSSHTTHKSAGAVLEAHPGQDLSAALAEAVAKLPAEVYRAPGKTLTEVSKAAQTEIPSAARVYGYFVHSDGSIRQRQPDYNGEEQSVPVQLREGELARVRGMAQIRDLARDLLNAERTDAADSLLERKRKALNAAYDAFVKEHGRLSREVNKRLFRDDPDIALLLSLEKDYDKGVSSTVAKKLGVASRKESATKADLFSKRLNYPERPVTSVPDAKSAMLASLNERGRLDADFMQQVYGRDLDTIEAELGDLVFRTPAGDLQPADLYLSGNVKAKLAEAQAGLRQNPALARNIAALEAVQPADVDPADIFVQVGTPWIPASDYAAFAKETFEGRLEGEYVRALGGWRVRVTSSNATLNADRWGTPRLPAGAILERLLEGKPIVVNDKDPDGKPVLNREATAAAKGKAEELQTAFLDWLWKDAARRERLSRFYNDTFNTDVRWAPNGAHLTLPGKTGAITLRPHQLNYVYRVIQTGVVLADHVVGAGKTYAAIAATMEMRRLGLWRKPMIVVPNHLVDQWAADFAKLYPGANVLAAGRKDFESKKRKQLFARIATGDWDAVIVAHSSFGFIPLPPQTEARILEAERDEIAMALDALRKESGKKDLSFKELQKREEGLKEKIKALASRKRDNLLDFAEMGIDALAVDEAHEFKNLYFVTTQRGVAGLGSPEGSKKAFDLFVKTRYLDEIGGKNRQFLTGTPVSNSLAETFHMQRYLQMDALKARGIAQFDAWAGVFGQIVADWEMDAAGRFKEKARFRKFANLPELVTLWRQVADTVTLPDLKRDAAAQGKRFPVPKIKGGKRNNITVERSPLQAKYIGEPVPRLDSEGKPVLDKETGIPLADYPEGSIIYRMDHMPKDASIDNHLKATGDARKASLDYRLIDPSAPDFPGSKINRMVAEVVRIHAENRYRRGTQLIFCDLSVPASARGKATQAAQDRVPTWFTTSGGELTHVAGVKLALSAMPGRPFFSVKDKHSYNVYEAGSGLHVGSGKTKQEAIDGANALLAQNVPEWEARFAEHAIPGDVIDAYVQRWEDAREAAKAALEADGKEAEAETGEEQEVISLDDLLADQSSFSVYDDVKAKLIAQGIPAAEVAFIHDYDTDARKADLFAKMNRGDIRVLMGSTAKMGAGMNVQRKLVALHHADAPWRPSDMTQREGRGIRQGNEFYEADPDGFEMIINAYGTRESYDSRQYEIIETKARGIETFKAGAADTREIDDIASESASSADMKAAASGNPLILESQKLRKEVRDLEAQARSHLSAMHAMESLIRSVDHKTAWPYKAQRDAQARAAKFAAEPWSLTLGKTTITEPKALKPAMVLAVFKDAADTRGVAIDGGRFRGLDIVVKAGPTAFQVGLYDGDTNLGTTEIGKDDNVNAAGFITRLENIFKRIEAAVPDADAAIQRIEREAGQAREEVKRGFPKQAELEAKRERQAKVVAALRAGKRAVDGDPAEGPKFSRPDTLGPGAWFKDSKVVNERGAPRVVYHGTGEEFFTFEDRSGEATEHPSAALGFFFAEDKPAAKYYAEVASKGVPHDEVIVDAYLSIQNPKRISLEDMQAFDHADEARAFRAFLEARGFDGIHVPESGIWIAFKPNQIKSASKNNGDFDPSNPDIRFSRGDGPAKGVAPDALRALVRQTTAGWGDNAPKVHALASADELPPAAKQAEGWEEAEGYYDDATGAVYLVAPNLRDAVRAREVLLHEAVGHYGMEAITGPALWAEIGDTIRGMRSSGKHADLFAEIGRRYVGANDAIFVREAVAVMAEKGVQNSVVDKVLAALRRFLRSLGMNLRLSEGELRQLIVAAARYVRSGSRPRVAPALRPEAAFSRTPGAFYSALLEAIERGQGAPKKGDAQAWQGWLDGAQRRGEIRQSERDWLGLDAFLARGVTTRAELADFIRANQIQVKDVVLGELSSGEEAMRAAFAAQGWSIEEEDLGGIEGVRYAYVDPDGEYFDYADLPAELKAEVDAGAQEAAGPVKYADRVLPGGQDYRELLLTLPLQHAGEGARVEFASGEKVEDFLVDMDTEGYGELDYGRVEGSNAVEFDSPIPSGVMGLIEANRGAIVKGQETAGRVFVSSHFTQPNILAHVRFNARTDADGKRVLFLEEIQSDWHQAGRKRGYGDQRPFKPVQRDGAWGVLGPNATFLPAEGVAGFPDHTHMAAESLANYMAGTTVGHSGVGVPDAPFKGTDEWALLAFKRMVRWAAEHGFERIAWTTGEQQVARYDLSKQVESVFAKRMGGEDRYVLTVYRKGHPDEALFDTGGEPIGAAKLAEVVGKDLADKIVADLDAPGARKSYEGLDLKVGGEGMRGFYDSILPKAVNKWAKRFGTNVGEASIPAPGQDAYTLGKFLVDGRAEWRVQDAAGLAVASYPTQAEAKAEADRLGALARAQVTPMAVHAIDVTPAMRDAALAGQPLFSRPDPASVLGGIDAAAKGPKLADVKAAFSALKENTRPTWLGALTLRHLAELGRDIKLPFVARYADRVQQMTTERNVMQDEAAAVAEPWEKFQRKDKAGADATANLMHDATIAGVDPAVDYRPLTTGTTRRGADEVVTAEAIARRIALVEADLADTTTQKAQARLQQEIQGLKDLLAQEQARVRAYPDLVRRWLALPEAGRAVYLAARDAYAKQSDALEAAILARIEGTAAAGRARQEAVTEIRHRFESARIAGPYFPLARFGEFWVSATDAQGEPFFSLYETVQDWRQAQTTLAAQGYTGLKAGRKIAEARSTAGASTGFMADLETLLEETGVPSSIRDDVWQLFLRTLPELSMRKHSIHRKKTAGYSKDALRAFAGNMFHGSFQIARVRHTHLLENELLDLKKAMEQLAAHDPERAAKAAALTTEVGLRHEWVMNPRDSKAVSAVTGLGFAWYLGATPASALVNLTQTAIVTFPVLASRFGVAKAANALTNGMRRALRNIDGKLERGLAPEELAAFKVWRDSGALTHTSAHNLAGLSETDTQSFNPVQRRVMTVISWLFHHTEMVNREATALAAFRLARQAGDDFATATKYAEDVITESHFDYTNANRARFMQSNAAKVLLLFRQYSLNMTWMLWRNAYLGLKGESPEVRRAARTKLAGVLGMTGLFAGAMGLPLMSVLFGIANAAGAVFGGDDDEPVDAEVAFRNFLADHLGPGIARVLTDGPVNALTGAEIGKRVSLNDLWLRDPDRELEGQAKADYLLEQAAGPVAGGMLVNTLRGWHLVEEGQTWRGVETMLPKALKDAMKAIRYSTQGVNTLRGDPIIEDLGVGGTLLQLAGFSPASLTERYDANNAAKNYEQRLLDRRSALLDGFALAWRNEDAEALAATRDRIVAWNAAHPELGITMATLRRSLEARIAYSARAEGGVVLDRRIAERARREARFAE